MRPLGIVKKTLLLVVLTAVLPALCIIVWSGVQDIARSRAVLHMEGAELVRAAAFRNQSVTENMRALLIAVSRFEEIGADKPASTRAIFRTILQQTPYFSNLLLATPEGHILTSALATVELPSGEKPFGGAFLAQAGQHAGLYVGHAERDPRSGRQALLFSYPVTGGSGAVSALILGGLRVDAFAFGGDIPKGAVIGLLDSGGSLIHSRPAAGPEAEAFSALKGGADAGLREGSLETRLADGEERLVLYRRLFLGDEVGPYMTVALSLPGGAVSPGLRSLLADVALLVLASLATWFFVSRLGGRALQRPIRIVLGAARRLRLGDYSARTDIQGMGGEMGSLVRSFDSMAESIEERDRERFLAKKLSNEYNQAKSAFLAAMSHAIRTPMNSVIGISYLLMKTDLNARQYSYVNRIYSSANTLLGIINDILDFSNIESGRFTIDRQLFNLDETLDGLLNLYVHKAEERRLSLRLEVAPDVPRRLYGDPLRLTQILTNLVGNAVKFTEQGGIVIRCATASEACEEGASGIDGGIVGGTAPGDAQSMVRLRFTVEDSGIGMTEGHVTALFDAYAQADESITRKYGGTGLGLAISRRLVQLMGGDIKVVSRFGFGTSMTFTACFGDAGQENDEQGESAVCRTSVSADADHGRGTGATAGGRMLEAMHVLLVEDNPVNQEIAAELLRDAGARVSIACNGEDALAVLTGNLPAPPVDLVLMDVQMPVMDGYEATRRIRAMDRFRDLPVIAMTAHAMTEERERCLMAGMNDHISKPIEIERFFAVIAACMKLPGVSGPPSAR